MGTYQPHQKWDKGLFHTQNIIQFPDTIWNKNKGTEIKLDIFIKGVQTTITIPLVIEYKYLGVIITRDLTPHAHIQALRKKIIFLINAFKSIGGASNSVKFCINTWHVFIRPLLDYRFISVS